MHSGTERVGPPPGPPPGLTDTHCHLDLPAFDGDRAACLARARAAGVRQVLVPGLHAGQWGPLRRLCAAEGLRFGVGTHPAWLTAGPPTAPEVPDDLTGASAIGECGLDATVPTPMARQIEVLEGHLALARETGLPIVLHCLRAHPQMLHTLRAWAPVRGVLHAYSGGPDLLAAYLPLGLHVSFAGPITWERARKPVEALRRVPLDRLLLETDAPDLCPRPHQGRNEPAFLLDVLHAAERIRGEPLVEALTTNTAALGWA